MMAAAVLGAVTNLGAVEIVFSLCKYCRRRKLGAVLAVRGFWGSEKGTQHITLFAGVGALTD